MIGKTAQLTFHEVLDQVAAKPAKPAAGELYLPSDDGAGRAAAGQAGDDR